MKGFILPQDFKHTYSIEQCIFNACDNLYYYSLENKYTYTEKNYLDNTIKYKKAIKAIPEKCIAKLNNATITGFCGVVTCEDRIPSVIISSLRTHTHNRNFIKNQSNEAKKNRNIIYKVIDEREKLLYRCNFPIKRIEGFSLSLTSPADIAFSHFCYDTFSKLLTLPRQFILNELKIIVGDTIRPYQLQLLYDFGFKRDKILIKPLAEDWLCDEMLAIQAPAGNNGYIIPAYFHEFRQTLLRMYPLANNTKPWPSKVYLDRDDERSQMRAIVNEAELKAIAIKHGFTVLTPGKLSFADKVAMFAHADCIIGQYGGGLQFGVTCPPHSKWLVLQSPHFYRHQINLHSALLPMDVLNLTGDAVEAKPKYLNNDPFKVDAQSFEAALVAHFN